MVGVVLKEVQIIGSRADTAGMVVYFLCIYYGRTSMSMDDGARNVFRSGLVTAYRGSRSRWWVVSLD